MSAPDVTPMSSTEMRSNVETDVAQLAVSADLRDSFERLKAELLTEADRVAVAEIGRLVSKFGEGGVFTAGKCTGSHK